MVADKLDMPILVTRPMLGHAETLNLRIGEHLID
jgi:hypothetical protein